MGRVDSQCGLSKEHQLALEASRPSVGDRRPRAQCAEGHGSGSHSWQPAQPRGSMLLPSLTGHLALIVPPSAPAASTGPCAEPMSALGFDPRTVTRDLVFPTILVLGIST